MKRTRTTSKPAVQVNPTWRELAFGSTIGFIFASVVDGFHPPLWVSWLIVLLGFVVYPIANAIRWKREEDEGFQGFIVAWLCTLPGGMVAETFIVPLIHWLRE